MFSEILLDQYRILSIDIGDFPSLPKCIITCSKLGRFFLHNQILICPFSVCLLFYVSRNFKSFLEMLKIMTPIDFGEIILYDVAISAENSPSVFRHTKATARKYTYIFVPWHNQQLPYLAASIKYSIYIVVLFFMSSKYACLS